MMINAEQDNELLHAQGEGHLSAHSPASSPQAPVRRRMGFGQKLAALILLTVVIIPPAAGFYSYFTGVPLRLVGSSKAMEKGESEASTTSTSIALVAGQPHTLQVADEVAAALQIRKGQRDSIAIAQPPTQTRPLVLPGSMSLIPGWLARIRARFAPARVVEIAKIWDRDPKSGMTEYRELRTGDKVSRGDLLAVFYSVDVGSKKNDLLDALVQLELDQKILDKVQAHREAVAEWYYLTQLRAVQGDRNAISKAINNLKAWEIPQDEIDALHAEAKKISADENSWSKTAEGRWVKGEKQSISGKVDPVKEEAENPWGRVALRAPFDGVIVEKTLHVGELVVDNTVNLFQIADVSRLQVIVHCPEDDLPTLEDLRGDEKKWTVKTVSAPPEGLQGTIAEIGYLIDPNQHTAVIKGYLDNPGERIRGTQYATATVNLPPPRDVVEIPEDALVDDGLQSIVFVQPDPAEHRFTMRRVQVTHRFEFSVYVRSAAIPKEEQLTAQDKEEGLQPKEPLRPGERVLVAGAVELKAALAELESRSQTKLAGPAEKSAAGSPPALEARREEKSKAGKG
jgi:membrane fusion protein, heavy metal efflux system